MVGAEGIRWLPVVAAMVLGGCQLAAPELEAFSSDGCSMVRGGTMAEKRCCFIHDLAYWQGGSSRERRQADAAFRRCLVGAKAGRTKAYVMYRGVRWFGTPRLPTSFRWSYGWPYGRFYQVLEAGEEARVVEERKRFRASVRGECRQRYHWYCSVVHLVD